MIDEFLKILKITKNLDLEYTIYENKKNFEMELGEIKNQRGMNVIKNLIKLVKKDEVSQKLLTNLILFDGYIEIANEREVPWDAKNDMKKYDQTKIDILEKHIKKIIFLDELTDEEMRKILTELEQK